MDYVLQFTSYMLLNKFQLGSNQKTQQQQKQHFLNATTYNGNDNKLLHK